MSSIGESDGAEQSEEARDGLHVLRILEAEESGSKWAGDAVASSNVETAS